MFYRWHFQKKSLRLISPQSVEDSNFICTCSTDVYENVIDLLPQYLVSQSQYFFSDTFWQRRMRVMEWKSIGTQYFVLLSNDSSTEIETSQIFGAAVFHIYEQSQGKEHVDAPPYESSYQFNTHTLKMFWMTETLLVILLAPDAST